jgi:YfiH family protein
LNRVEIGELLRPDGALDIGAVDAFSGLTGFITTVPSLKRYDILRPFYEDPTAQISDGRIDEGYVEALCEAFSLPYDALETGAQVHGARIVAAENVERRHNPATDGLIVSKAGGCAAVFTADCQPIVLWDAVRVVAAVVHAGWRGTVAGIAAAGVKTMRETFGSVPEGITAFLGPAISAENYEIGPEVAEEVVANFPGGEVLVTKKGKTYMDITECNRLSLVGAGASDGNIYSAEACTYRDVELFYSYRREGARAGRTAAVVYSPEARG